MARFWPFLVATAACTTAPPAPAPARPSAPAVAAPSAAPSAVATAARAPVSEPRLVEFMSGPRLLRGFLYRPAGAGPFPGVVFNHGSEPLPGNKAGQAAFFVPHGYVLFVPHRRGQGQSADAGESINTVASDPVKFVAALDAQEEDVGAAINYLAALSFVDAHRIAVSGCSLGGIESLLAAERETSIVAAVDFAGGAITWAKTPPLQERMKKAARGARVPVFFIQAENDYDTSPSRVLGEEMRLAKKPARIHIFPPNGTTPAEGHGFCGGGENPPWGAEVLAFLDQAMKAKGTR